ncbi:DUF3219 domain-containing protein [Salipaludibacillus neizhouensis]|uniref:DUF3219 domain-containing protein n=1 Tax=Salipaludibacillus neizhouensis TaxID=885475 RepID=A0A3A9K2S4_9BACI|nr:DUF3219 family protein [Salipaludibacillus neizhouensis]RKL66649.1 DUF3219 domain-containing protein [Salipaludibacillus neizhouensis]
MVKKVILNETPIDLEGYEEDIVDGLIKISLLFNVSHRDYHEITTLLYKGTFDVKVPDKNLSFKGTIHNYSTSITNLYKQESVGEFHLSLIELA